MDWATPETAATASITGTDGVVAMMTRHTPVATVPPSRMGATARRANREVSRAPPTVPMP